MALHINLQRWRVRVADVTGAGDTVIAAVAAGLGAGISLASSAELANQAAGIVVSKLGTATVSGRELESALSVDHGIFIRRRIWPHGRKNIGLGGRKL